MAERVMGTFDTGRAAALGGMPALHPDMKTVAMSLKVLTADLQRNGERIDQLINDATEIIRGIVGEDFEVLYTPMKAVYKGDFETLEFWVNYVGFCAQKLECVLRILGKERVSGPVAYREPGV